MENKSAKTSKKTLLWSVLLSAPGPLVVGLGLLVGKSNSQLADFFRRSAELIGLISAYITYSLTNVNGQIDEEKKIRLERISNITVGAMMIIAGSIMLVLSILSKSNEKGNVIPGLTIAVLGVIANTIFWIKYSRLDKQQNNAILHVQKSLYRAKSLVDICVTLALLSIVILPGTSFSYYVDKAGSAIVSCYLIFCGVKTVLSRIKE